MRSVLSVHWKDWYWSWSSNTLATWYEELTHLKRPWLWERLRAGGEGDDRGWDGWMASPTRWIWVWSSNTLATWCEELTHLKRPWLWERLRAGGEGDDRGWDGWMASPSRWTWVWWTLESVMDMEAWCAAVHGVTKSLTWMNNWTEVNCVIGATFLWPFCQFFPLEFQNNENVTYRL